MPLPHRWPLAGVLALLLVLTGAAGAASAPPELTPDPPRPAATAAATGAAVTLVTGDRVQAQPSPNGRYAVTVDPAPRADGTAVSFQTIDDGEQLYVLPSDAAPLVPDRLDLELFNVTKLAEYGYLDRVPVITAYRSGTPRVAAAGVTTTATLSSIGATAATVDDGGEWWNSATALAGVARVWLDERVEASLADSVPQVGAPQAWAAGFDGTGVTVAVLDTGIDARHPDLAGKVRSAENFTGSETATDRHGHGTHVAGIVAGTGAASGGDLTGVAPGAELLNGKVLDDDGFGSVSGIIAGMEWAAGQGADVISMSLGGPGGDGSDPLSQAVNRLTAQHDVLFTIAAGNRGSGDQTLDSPGVADAALTVGAVDDADQLAGFSSAGRAAATSRSSRT